MSEYMPTLEDAKRTYAYIQGGLDHDEGYKPFYQVHEEAFDRLIAEVERAAANRVLLELLPVLEEAVANAYLCQQDRGVGDEWDDEIARAEAALARARAAEIREKGRTNE